jgi:hypothetical protein
MAEADRFALPPLRFAACASAEDLDAWLARAPAGALFVYARGGVLDPECAVARRAKALREAGAVRLNFRKVDGEGEYLATRLAPVAPPPQRRDPPGENSIDGRVLRALDRAARRGQPCPTNRELAIGLGLADAASAGHIVRKLAAAGHISIERRGTWLRRVVTLCRSGARTSADPVPAAVPFGADEDAGS